MGEGCDVSSLAAMDVALQICDPPPSAVVSSLEEEVPFLLVHLLDSALEQYLRDIGISINSYYASNRKCVNVISFYAIVLTHIL